MLRPRTAGSEEGEAFPWQVSYGEEDSRSLIPAPLAWGPPGWAVEEAKASDERISKVGNLNVASNAMYTPPLVHRAVSSIKNQVKQ